MLKKVLLFATVISCTSYAGTLIIKGGGSFNGNFHKDYWKEDTRTSVNYQGALELEKELAKYFSLSFGSGYYQGGRLEKYGSQSTKGEDFNSVLFNSIPVYIGFKFHLSRKHEIVPYVKINGGYSYNLDGSLSDLLNHNIENSYYYGAGFGVEANKLVLEVLYETNMALIQNEQKNEYNNTDYNRISAFIGIRF